MNLRPYQKEVIQKLSKALLKKPKSLLIAPTGSGKTVITSNIIIQARSRGRQCWFIVHRDELVQQTVETLRMSGIEEDIGVIKAGYKPNPEAMIQVVSAQSMSKRNSVPDAGAVLIIDECHTTSYFKCVHDIIKSHQGFVIGVTATPWRFKKTEGLADLYGQHVMTPAPSELIEQGFLSPARVYGFSDTYDIKKVKTARGDFATDELSRVCNTDGANALITLKVLELAKERTGIIFAVDVAHAQALAKQFNDAGLTCEVVTGETPTHLRQAIYERLRRGEVRFISSVGVLTEGFDIKSISCVVLARPTKSKVLYVQMFGRGLRICEAKENCLILDFGGNHARFGIASELTQEEMEPDYPNSSRGKAPSKECPDCNMVMRSSLMSCPQCGHVFQSRPKEKEEIKGQFVELTSQNVNGVSKELRSGYGKFVIEAMNKGYSPKWPEVQFHQKYNRWPRKAEKWQAAFSGNVEMKKTYWSYLFMQAKKLNKSKAWAINFYRYEFGQLKDVGLDLNQVS